MEYETCTQKKFVLVCKLQSYVSCIRMKYNFYILNRWRTRWKNFENGDEQNVSLNKWQQAGQVLNIIQFKFPTIFHIFNFSKNLIKNLSWF